MVTVVNKTPHSSVVKEIVCRHCGVTLHYVPKDVKFETRYDYGGGADTYRYIECPECKTEVDV